MMDTFLKSYVSTFLIIVIVYAAIYFFEDHQDEEHFSLLQLIVYIYAIFLIAYFQGEWENRRKFVKFVATEQF